MGMSHHRWEGYELMVSRTGFTGDLGYELWIAPEGATLLWNRLMVAGHVRGIRPIGYQALDMARIEAGFIRPMSTSLRASMRLTSTARATSGSTCT